MEAEKKMEDEKSSTRNTSVSFAILTELEKEDLQEKRTLGADGLKRELDALAFKIKLLYGRK